VKTTNNKKWRCNTWVDFPYHNIILTKDHKSLLSRKWTRAACPCLLTITIFTKASQKKGWGEERKRRDSRCSASLHVPF
jgi:hypothetical protein